MNELEAATQIAVTQRWEITNRTALINPDRYDIRFNGHGVEIDAHFDFETGELDVAYIATVGRSTSQTELFTDLAVILAAYRHDASNRDWTRPERGWPNKAQQALETASFSGGHNVD